MLEEVWRLEVMMSTIPPLASRTHKVLMAIWFLPSVCLLGFLATGFAADAPSAYLAFGFLPASVLSALAVVGSYWVKRGTETVARWVWISHCLVLLGLLVAMATAANPSPGLDMSTILTYVMLISAFPVSILVVMVMAGLGWLVDFGIPSLFGDPTTQGRVVELGFVILAWLVYVLLGYWQWFSFFPKIIRRFLTGRRYD